MECWRDIPEYEGLYQVSNTGKVKGLKSGKVLKQGQNPNGRWHVSLCKDGVPITKAVHVLVALAWLTKIPGKTKVLHNDGNHNNNNDWNLRYGTSAENSADMIKHGNSLKGQKATFSKLTEEMVKDIRNSNKGTNELAKQYSVTRHAIMNVKARRTWAHI